MPRALLIAMLILAPTQALALKGDKSRAWATFPDKTIERGTKRKHGAPVPGAHSIALYANRIYYRMSKSSRAPLPPPRVK